MRDDTSWVLTVKGSHFANFIGDLHQKEKLTVRIKPDDSYFITVEFLIKEVEKALEPVKQACNIK